MKSVKLEEVFGNKFNEDVLYDILNEELEEISKPIITLDYNEGWYNYSTMKFNYEGKMYSVQFAKHTSENVSDIEFEIETLSIVVEEESEEKISLKKYLESISELEKELKKSNNELKEYKDLLAGVNRIPISGLNKIGEFLIEDSEGGKDVLSVLGEFLIKFAEFKGNKVDRQG